MNGELDEYELEFQEGRRAAAESLAAQQREGRHCNVPVHCDRPFSQGFREEVVSHSQR
jgi:hypothetical protein